MASASYKTKEKIMKINLKRTLCSVISGICLILSLHGALAVSAQISEDQLKKDITRTVQEMESIMQRSYDHAKDELSDLCAAGYDYELSMESFTDQGLPFSNYDYQEFIAIYATIQQYCFKNGIDLKDGINSIDFVKMETIPSELSEYIPEQTDSYISNGDGTYSISGTTYLTEPGNIYTYVKNDNGTYMRTGQEYHELEQTQTPYLEINLTAITPDDIYKTFGVDREILKEDEEARLMQLKEVMGNAELSQLTFITSGEGASEEDKDILLRAMELSESRAQQILINIAGSIIGRIPYEWGGKSDHAGFDESWYLFDSTMRQKGLDCSGYMQWILRTAGFENWDQLVSTSDFLASELLYPITADELKPGDFGLFYPDSKTHTNHIGMYLGEGNWIHCSSTANTVTITNGGKFSIYRRLGIFTPQPVFFDTPETINVEEYASAQETPVETYASDVVLNEYVETHGESLEAPDDELMMMAKIVQLESQAEGYNGWVGVAQVIRNRVLMPEKFPNTIMGVISEDKQFSTYTKACAMDNSQVDQNILIVCRKVMAGELKVFDSDQVIAFKRVSAEDGKWGRWTKYMTLGNHSFYTL